MPPESKQNLIPPAGLINAEYLVSVFSKELIETHKKLKGVKSFHKNTLLKQKAETLRHKIDITKTFTVLFDLMAAFLGLQ